MTWEFTRRGCLSEANRPGAWCLLFQPIPDAPLDVETGEEEEWCLGQHSASGPWLAL